MPSLDAATVLQLLIYGLTNGAVVALTAIGFTLAYAVARQINLAYGNVFAVSTVVVATVATWLGITAEAPLWQRVVAVAVVSLCGAACGTILNVGVERLAFRPFRATGDSLGPLIATVGLSFILYQGAIWWRAAFQNPRSLQSQLLHNGVVLPLLAMPDLIPNIDLTARMGVSFTLKDLIVLALATMLAIGVGAFLMRTRAGRLLRAAAQDPELTTLSGGDPARAQLFAFALAGALAGFAAAIFSTYTGAASGQFGLRTGLAAITAAVLGGVGNPRGALLAGVLIGVVSSFNDYLLDPQWTPVLVLVLLIVLLAWRPTGVLSAGSASLADAGSTTPTTFDAARPGTRSLLVALLMLAIVYPMLDAALGWQRIASVTAILLLVALGVGLSVVVGLAGLIDLGYAAFFAIGGYTAALLTSSGSRLSLSLPAGLREPWLALPLAGLVAAGFGIAFGLPSVRTRGEYLAIVTLAFGEIVPGVIWHLPYWTGGANGLSGVPLPALLPAAFADRSIQAYGLALLLATTACVVVLRLASSRTG
ncbi:MAG: hypothetical protein JOZ81_01225, partial [Chloroflexi bacterium]|nr:hypothetical protein [Chloroflexota bacterium]